MKINRLLISVVFVFLALAFGTTRGQATPLIANGSFETPGLHHPLKRYLPAVPKYPVGSWGVGALII